MDYRSLLRQSILSKYAISGLVIYAIWVCFWLMYANILLPDVEFLDTHFPSRLKPSDFSVSYAASAFDSLVFFGLVGSVLTLLTTRSPKDEKLSTKVDYIFPGSDSDDKLSGYLQKCISSLACMSPLTNRTITFQHHHLFHNEEKFAIKMYTKTNALIKNIHNNHEYVLDDAIFKAQADLIDGIDVLGEIHDLAIIKKFSGLELPDKEQILKGSHTLTNDANEFEQRYRMQLMPNETIQFMTSGWMWQCSDNVMTYTAARYTKKQQLDFFNELNFDLKLEISSPEKGAVDITIHPGEKATEIFDALMPGGKITVKIKTSYVDITAGDNLN
ncbi:MULTISPECIES: hypothetical protein [Shewanella]|uniref:hypothetical protein n=1 Tax=Shewanella TaxID=22 RepID=UPI002167D62D|nr:MULTISPECIES: hypothetical protein [Shewanella]MCS6114490.1 hypothetical protein [Shewanella baltica]MCU8034398.1 hypothetical protein [Shewanella sp. SM71]MCU8096105.1 hypothetical protein [Shewanella sp. SM102]UVW65396.1 hypothetical protein HHE93_18210 [Shewanella baltica]